MQNDTLRVLSLVSRLRAQEQDKVAKAAAGGVVRGNLKSVEERQGRIFARQRSALMLTVLRGAALRLTGKHWDRGLTVAQRHAVAVRTLEDQEEELAALAALAASGGRGSGGVVIQAYPVG